MRKVYLCGVFKDMIFELNELVKRNDVIPVCIFTPGRVGTIAVKEALSRQGVFAIHFHKSNPRLPSVVEYYGDYINKIVTIVRDPIERMTTEIFFEHSKYGLTVADSYNPIKLIDAILNECESPRVFNWFGDQFRGLLDIDVFGLEFNKDRGGAHYKIHNKDLIILKNEYIGVDAHSYLSNIIEIPRIQKQVNRTTDREWAHIQPFLRDNLIVPDDLIDKVYSNKYVTHFYTDAEISTFKDKWNKSRGEWEIRKR